MKVFPRAFLFIFLSWFFLSINASAQVDNTVKVDSIVFVGNKRTKSSYLLRVLDIQLGEQNAAELDASIRRLPNLNGLYDQSYSFEQSPDGFTILEIHVKEQRTKLPVLNFGVVDEYRWFQLGYVDINLGGVGNEIFTYYQNNEGRHSGQLFLKFPSIFHSDFGLSTNVLRWRSIEPLYFSGDRLLYNYDINLAGISGHYQPNLDNQFELGFSIFQENYNRREDLVDIIKGPDMVSLLKVLLKAEYRYNEIRFSDFLQEGYRLATRYQYVNTLDYDVFHAVEWEGAYFRKIDVVAGKRINLAVRSHIGIASNNESPFSPFVIDSYRNIRGVGDRIMRGTSIATVNVELRQTIISSNSWVLMGVVFSDSGALRQPGADFNTSFSRDALQSYAGLGARLIYKPIFNAILRIDYGINVSDYGERGFVVGLGQYF